jgi:TetR/AcrR family transcriptional repressor of nem operon
MFDIKEATQKAMGVFWEKGYDGASLPDLLAGMEITRGSFYKAYAGKKPLFMSALELYNQECITPGVIHLSGPKTVDGWDRIMALFNKAVTAAAKGDRRGCLVCTAAAGPAAYDAEIAKAVNLALDNLRGGFETAIAASQTHSHINKVKRKDFAGMLTTHYVGLRILSRSQAPIEKLEHSVRSIHRLAGIQA